MNTLDRIRQLFFTLIFLAFTAYTIHYFNYDPSPVSLEGEAKDQWASVKLDFESLCDGDLVLRHGRGFISDAIITFMNGKSEYSHSGILRIEDGRYYVYHAIGGEENETNYLKRERLELYCHPNAVLSFGIFRFETSKEILTRMDSVIQTWYRQKVEFDFDFEMKTNEQMYCSEMIWKAMEIATNNENFIPLSTVLEKPYVLIDDLYLNHPHCQKIFTHHYEY